MKEEMTMKSKLLSVILSAIILVVLTAGCSLGAPSDPPVRLLLMNEGWDSQKFHNQLARFVVENGFDGYVVEEITGSTHLLWQALIDGDIDLNTEMWPMNLATYERDVAGGYVIELGIVVEASVQGLYVPRFVVKGDPERGIEPMAPTLRTVEDLLRYPHVFRDPDRPARGRIYGSVPGWTADEILYRMMSFHGLHESFNYFRPGSEAALFASLESAYNFGEPWVGYSWEPSWVVGRFDLILLEAAPYDPVLFAKGGTEIPGQALTVVSSSQFASRAPDLVDFFSRFRTGSQNVSNVLNHMRETRASPEEAAIWFLKNNDSLLDEWLTPEQAYRVREALSRI